MTSCLAHARVLLVLLPALAFAQAAPGDSAAVQPQAKTDSVMAAPTPAAPDSATAQAAPDSTQAAPSAAPVLQPAEPPAMAAVPAPDTAVRVRNVDSASERSSWLKVRSRFSASVLLDGAPAGDLVPDDSTLGVAPVCIWRSRALPPGLHRVRVEADLCTPWEAEVDLPAGRATTVEASIDWSPEEKARRHRARLKGPRIVLGIGTALSAAFALSSASSLQSAKDQRASATADYAAATIRPEQYNSRLSKANSDADSSRQSLGLGVVLAGLCALGFGATWVF